MSFTNMLRIPPTNNSRHGEFVTQIGFSCGFYPSFPVSPIIAVARQAGEY
jgi:hypothetical protein